MATTKNFEANLMNLQSNLLNFAYMLTSNRDDAYDLLQDTTLKALDNQEKYAEGTNFKGWVFTIMRNLFINNYRRGFRHRVSRRQLRRIGNQRCYQIILRRIPHPVLHARCRIQIQRNCRKDESASRHRQKPHLLRPQETSGALLRLQIRPKTRDLRLYHTDMTKVKID